MNGEVSTVCGRREFLLSLRTPTLDTPGRHGTPGQARAKGFSWRFLFSTFCHHKVTFNNCVFLSTKESKACFELVANYRQKCTSFPPSGWLEHWKHILLVLGALYGCLTSNQGPLSALWDFSRSPHIHPTRWVANGKPHFVRWGTRADPWQVVFPSIYGER